MGADLVKAVDEPPTETPGEGDREEKPFLLVQALEAAMEEERGGEAGDSDDDTAGEASVQNHLRSRGPGVHEKHETRQNLERASGDARQEPALASADPHHGSSLERPEGRGDEVLESEGHRERGEDDSGSEKGLAQIPRHLGPISKERYREHDVEGAECQSAPRHPVLVIANESALEHRRRERHSEDQGSIDDSIPARCLPQREDHGDGDVEKEEDDEKRLRRREVLGTVVAVAPTGGDDKREQETEKVQEP